MTTPKRQFSATMLAPGGAEGPVFLLAEPLSFWGGLDSSTGRIIDRWHPQKDEVITGKILLMKAGRGSSSGSSVLAEAIRLGNGPSGIVLLSRDAIVTVGAMVAAELYDIACPVVMARAEDWAEISTARNLALLATSNEAIIALP